MGLKGGKSSYDTCPEGKHHSIAFLSLTNLIICTESSLKVLVVPFTVAFCFGLGGRIEKETRFVKLLCNARSSSFDFCSTNPGPGRPPVLWCVCSPTLDICCFSTRGSANVQFQSYPLCRCCLACHFFTRMFSLPQGRDVLPQPAASASSSTPPPHPLHG